MCSCPTSASSSIWVGAPKGGWLSFTGSSTSSCRSRSVSAKLRERLAGEIPDGRELAVGRGQPELAAVLEAAAWPAGEPAPEERLGGVGGAPGRHGEQEPKARESQHPALDRYSLGARD